MKPVQHPDIRERPQHPGPYEIPDVTRAEVRARCDRMEPLVADEDGDLCTIQHPDPWDVAYTWDPKIKGKVKRTLYPLRTILTLHGYGYHGMFKPSMAEVVRQIPEDLLPHVTAYHINGPKNADDLNHDHDALNEGYHVATAVLYGANPYSPSLEEKAQHRLDLLLEDT